MNETIDRFSHLSPPGERSIGAADRVRGSSLPLLRRLNPLLQPLKREQRSFGRGQALTRPSLRSGHPLPKGEGARNRRLAALPCCLLPAACCLLSACGTNQRTLVITSDPPGALVHVNDVQLGETPLEADFTWFGKYDVRLSKPGFEPLVTAADAKPNLHDQPVFDFFSEVLPGTRNTVVRWHFTLEPEDTDTDALLRRAREAQDNANLSDAQNPSQP